MVAWQTCDDGPTPQQSSSWRPGPDALVDTTVGVACLSADTIIRHDHLWDEGEL
jgi:hypothetical protein